MRHESIPGRGRAGGGPGAGPGGGPGGGPEAGQGQGLGTVDQYLGSRAGAGAWGQRVEPLLTCFVEPKKPAKNIYIYLSINNL